jgi:ABC-type lipoprotein export system ATPase subunit
MVTHDQQVAARADRRIVLRDGLVISDEFVGDLAGASMGELR